MDVLSQAGVLQEEGHTGFLHLPSAVIALIFTARRVLPYLSLVDREVEFRILRTYEKIQSFSTCRAFLFFFHIDFFVGKNPSSCDCTEIRTHVPTSEGFELNN